MLCEVTSSARCWASRPRSEVWMPTNVEIDIALGLDVEDAVRDRRGGPRGGGRAGRGGRAVARLRLGADQAREVVEERELLAHQRAVDAVLAGDLGQQPAQLRAAGAGELRLGRGHEPRDRLERDAGRVESEG